MKRYILIITAAVLFTISGCTNLDEQLFDKISAENFYTTDEEINAGLMNVYYQLAANHIWLNHWQLQECTTDHGMCPWGDGGVYKQAQLHTWDATHGPMGNVYSGNYTTIAAANSFLSTLLIANPPNLEVISAEVRAIRAYSYLELVDLFANVPIVTTDKLDPSNLPKNAARVEVFNFIESELKDAISKLPSLKSVANRQALFPRIAKETAQAMLVKLYLNAEVYSGTARWQDCVAMADEVINSGLYILEPNIWDAFAPENDKSLELIFAISKTNTSNWDVAAGNWTNVLSMHGELKGAYRNGKDMNILYNGWGGPSVLEEHLNIYDDSDFRKSLILMGKFYDRDGNLLIDIQPFSNTNVNNFNSPKEGLSCIKYQPDPLVVPPFQRNDLVIIRYSDILLSKAEALFRLGNASTALTIVNDVRKRNFSPEKPLASLTEEDLLAERSREFLWETSYRSDLVRFGKFTTVRTKWKTYNDESYRNIFPIPQVELQTNTNLTQNPGY